MTEDAIECAATVPEGSGSAAHIGFRLGGDTRVGEAMGYHAVSVDADLAVGIVTRALDEAGVVIAIVVDHGGRLVGLVDAAEAALARASMRARELARPCEPIRESAPLSSAVDQMVRKRVRALAVVDDEGHVVALLTDLDALHWVARRTASQ
jgi:CBS domain-containing protein